jgi:carbon monoxide dehydrogenase subunit G
MCDQSNSQTISAYQSPSHVATDLDFGQMGKATATWNLEPAGAGTKVTWGFRTQAEGIVARWFGLMFDRWIGVDYEKGLARLKAAAEK